MGGGSCSSGDVFIRGEPVGDTSWDITDADVICRQMGFDMAIKSTNDRRYYIDFRNIICCDHIKYSFEKYHNFKFLLFQGLPQVNIEINM